MNKKQKIAAGVFGFLVILPFTAAGKKIKSVLTSYLNNMNLVRGLRNNNPLNIKLSSRVYLGSVPRDKNTDKVHEQFENFESGVAAAIIHMTDRYINGKGWSATNCDTPKKTYTAPFDTLSKIANVWAPKGCDKSAGLPAGNNPNEYINA